MSVEFLKSCKMRPFKRRESQLGFKNNFDYLRSLGESRKRKALTHSYSLRRTCRLKEYDLEQKIDLEIKMREGTTRLLAACKHPMQTLEAAKSLLTSNERMTAYMAELQHRKVLQRSCSTKGLNDVSVQPSKAKVAVSDIRMPLIWKDTDHFKNKGDYRRFAVFCLLKVGTEIYDTIMVNNVDRSMTDITFEDVIVFNNVPPDFEFRLEVYSHVLHDDLSIASTPRKIKRKINDSISRTVGKKLAATLKEELASGELGPKFDLVAHSVLRLCDVHESIKTHDLQLENLENHHHQLPLFGHFCCRLAAQPECLVDERISGFLSIVQQVGEVSCLRRFWCTLRNQTISVWGKLDDVGMNVEPYLKVSICKECVFMQDQNSAYSNAFLIRNPANGRCQDFVFVADNGAEMKRWIAQLTQHLRDQLIWRNAAEKFMEIQTPTPFHMPFFGHHRKGSLYDETSLKADSPRTGQENVHDTLNISPLLRPRSRSSSSSSSSAASSIGGRFQIPSFHHRLSKHEITH